MDADQLHIRVLGAVEIECGGRVVAVAAGQQRLVLAALAVNANRPLPAGDLIEAVWDEPPAGAIRTLQVVISRVKRLVESASSGAVRLSRRSGGYLLEIAESQVDVYDIKALVEEARRRDCPAGRRAVLLDQAMQLWRGPPLAGLSGRWADRIRQGWQRFLVTMAADWAYAHLAINVPEKVIVPLTSLAIEHPLDEPIAAALIEALYRTGRVTDALAHHTHVRQRLRDELGRDPSPRLRELQVLMLTSDRGGVEPPRLWSMPPRATDMVARPGLLARIREQLTRGPVALTGPPGMGKTRLAVEYAHQFARHYPLVWWLAAERAELLDTQFAHLAAESGVASAADTMAASASARRYLNTLRPGAALLIFDNAATDHDVRPWLPATAHVLVTSRSPIWTETATVVPVDVFSREDSVGMLRTRLPALPQDDAARIAEALGDLPLALAQAAGLMSQHGLSADEYLAALSANAVVATDQVISPHYPRSLASTVRLSASQLAADHPDAADLLDVYAQFAPEPISPSMLSAGRAGVPASLAALGRIGLVRVDPGAVQMHRLIGAIVRDGLSPDRRHRAVRQAQAVLIGADPGEIGEPANRLGWDRLMPHLFALAAVDEDEPGFRDLACRAVTHLLVHCQYSAGWQLVRRLYEAWTARLGPDHADTLAAGRRYAMARQCLGDFAGARDLRQELVSRHVKQLGPDHPATLIVTQHLAWVLERLGDTAQAYELIEDVYRRQLRTVGADDPQTLLSASTSARHTCQRGHFARGVRLARDTYQRALQIMDAEHPWTLFIADDLAQCLGAAGHFDEAHALAEQTWARFNRAVGEGSADTLNAAARVAWLLHLRGDEDAARRLLDQTIDQAREIHGMRWRDIVQELHSVSQEMSNGLRD